MADAPRPKRVAHLRHELAQLKVSHADHLNAAKLIRQRMDEVEAILEQLGAAQFDAELGSFSTELQT